MYKLTPSKHNFTSFTVVPIVVSTMPKQQRPP